MSFLKKIKQHVTQKEFLMIEGYNLLSIFQFFVSTALFMMSYWVLFSYVKIGMYQIFVELADNLTVSNYSPSDILETTNNVFSGLLLLFIFPITLVFITRNVLNQDYRKFMKNFILSFMLFIAGSMATATFSTSNLTSRFYGTFIVLLVMYIVLLRFNYLMRIKLLMSLGIVKTQRISLLWKNSLNSIIWQPDSLIFLNKKWLPFVTVTMSGTSETILDSEWKQPDTSTGYTIKIESCLSGVSIQKCISSPFVTEKEIAFESELINSFKQNNMSEKEQLKYFETNNITEESLLIGRQRSSKMEVLERTELLNHKNVIQQPLENGHSLIMGKAMAGRYRPTTDELRKEENNG
ncbi:hypothetical protein [Vagococcus carniphilus]|uniref:hypothetical protein n=1 Tax=Vagococcus carniphilus TaxID=218144 RepID=UPI00288F43C5|nr:hypothetical protein [Vagococcus carniphilus]MDT2840915.1 hypothetical protein [Vagococcus carniphilus]